MTFHDRGELGEFFADVRQQKGLTLRQAAKLTDVDNAHISQIELGKIRDPRFSVMVRLCKGYGLDIRRVARLALESQL